VGPATWDKSLRSLVPGGRLVVCGGTSGQKVELSLPRLFFKHYELIGSTMGSYEEWAQVVDFVGQGLPIVVDQVFPLADYPKAVERLEQGAQLGNIVLQH
jgi:zinc-binding alcohol dehydrogenase/oxidoreductase